MDDRTTAIRTELVGAQVDLIGVLDRAGADDWERASPNEGWTVRDLLTHLSTSEQGFVGTLRRMAAGEGGVPQDFDPNRWNAGQVRRNTDTAPVELRQRLEAAHSTMLEVLDGLDHAALDQRGWLSTGVEGSTEDCFRLVASHKRAHTADIRAALVLAV
jgi:uncharacterized protein (TIGR03083 family)